MSDHPRVDTSGPRDGARAVVLVLHGGAADSHAAGRRGLAWLRMVPFARAVRAPGVAVWTLRYRYRGWNTTEDPVADARWALAEARRRHPGAPIVLVGHSMGGRVALRLADEPDVAGVCALAPWIEPGEPAPALHGSGAGGSTVPQGPGFSAPSVGPGAGGNTVLIAHGEHDRMTDPAASKAYAARIGASFVPVPGESHALLRRPIFWQRLVTGFVRSVLGADTHAG
jgi:pimeloyl-ACP methyl ester carboxylesterase